MDSGLSRRASAAPYAPAHTLVPRYGRIHRQVHTQAGSTATRDPQPIRSFMSLHRMVRPHTTSHAASHPPARGFLRVQPCAFTRYDSRGVKRAKRYSPCPRTRGSFCRVAEVKRNALVARRHAAVAKRSVGSPKARLSNGTKCSRIAPLSRARARARLRDTYTGSVSFSDVIRKTNRDEEKRR